MKDKKNMIIRALMALFSILMVYSFEIESPGVSDKKYLFLGITIVLMLIFHSKYYTYFNLNEQLTKSALISLVSIIGLSFISLVSKFGGWISMDFAITIYSMNIIAFLITSVIQILAHTKTKLFGDLWKIFVFYALNAIACYALSIILLITVYPVFG